MTKNYPDDKYILVNLEESDPRIAFANATITVSFRIADFGFFCLSCNKSLVYFIKQCSPKFLSFLIDGRMILNPFTLIYHSDGLKFRVFTMHGGLSVKDLEFSQPVYF